MQERTGEDLRRGKGHRGIENSSLKSGRLGNSNGKDNNGRNGKSRLAFQR